MLKQEVGVGISNTWTNNTHVIQQEQDVGFYRDGNADNAGGWIWYSKTSLLTTGLTCLMEQYPPVL